MSFQEIKSEPIGDVEGAHEHMNERADDFSNICFDYENNIPIKEEIKQEIKSEPLGEEVERAHEHLNERADDFSNICFDHEDKIPIKEEVKQEIKPEPMNEDNIDVETHSCEDDQEKSDLKAMVEKLLIEKQTLQKDMDKLQSEKNNVEKQLEEKNEKFEELQVENQTLKEQMNLQSAQLPLNALNSNKTADKHPAEPLKKVKKFGQKPDLNRHTVSAHIPRQRLIKK